MTSRLTKVDSAVLEIAEGAQSAHQSADQNEYTALIAIMDAYKISMDKAASLLVNARMSEAALREMTK